jgi:WD40 repeat protein
MNCLVEYGSSDSENEEDADENSTFDNKQASESSFQENAVGLLSQIFPECPENTRPVGSEGGNDDVVTPMCRPDRSMQSVFGGCGQEAKEDTQNHPGPGDHRVEEEGADGDEKNWQFGENKFSTSTVLENDFFNLSSDSDSVSEAEDISNKITKNIDTQFGSVVIPSGKFWDDFTPTEISIREQSDPGADKKSYSFKRRKKGNQLPPSKYHKTDDISVAQDLPKPALTSNKNISKNIYYVHHKVGPYLVSSPPPSRPPRKEIVKVNAHGSGINRLKWCSKKEYSHLVTSASMDTTVKIWNMFSAECSPQKELQTLENHSKGVRDVAWSHSAKEILSCGYDKKVFISDIEKGISVQSYDHNDYVTCLGVHPVEPHLFVSGTKNAILCWDTRMNTREPVREFRYKDDFGQVNTMIFTVHLNTWHHCL